VKVRWTFKGRNREAGGLAVRWTFKRENREAGGRAIRWTFKGRNREAGGWLRDPYVRWYFDGQY